MSHKDTHATECSLCNCKRPRNGPVPLLQETAPPPAQGPSASPADHCRPYRSAHHQDCGQGNRGSDSGGSQEGSQEGEEEQESSRHQDACVHRQRRPEGYVGAQGQAAEGSHDSSLLRPGRQSARAGQRAPARLLEEPRAASCGHVRGGTRQDPADQPLINNHRRCGAFHDRRRSPMANSSLKLIPCPKCKGSDAHNIQRKDLGAHIEALNSKNVPRSPSSGRAATLSRSGNGRGR